MSTRCRSPIRHLNIKPSRFGPLSRLFECIDACLERGIELYGGGQFELGVGRGQIQEIASLFYPDTPNDVAPSVYNAPEPVAGLPQSPLVAAGAARRLRLVIALALAAVALLAAPPKPAIVQRPIPFGPERRAEMAAYSKRHYGTAQWRLIAPKVIVEHYTVGDTFTSAYNTFAPDHADPELHELPDMCAHFVIDKDGTIYQLVPLDDPLPPHGRAQLDGHRHRARRPLCHGHPLEPAADSPPRWPRRAG